MNSLNLLNRKDKSLNIININIEKMNVLMV